MDAIDTDLSFPASHREVKYPPAPWQLTGQLYGSVWAVPFKVFRGELPPDFEPLVGLGWVGPFAGFVDYQEGSTLQYHELIAGLLVRLKGSWRYAFTVTHMWVDDEASKWGGRELWGVPKELADFNFTYSRANHDFEGQARTEHGRLASANFRSLAGLPSRMGLPTIWPNLQMLRGQPHRSSGTFWSSLQFCGGGMEVPAESPLAALGMAGRKPLISFAGLDFRMNLQAARPVRRNRE